MSKRMVSLILMALMLLSFVPVTASAVVASMTALPTEIAAPTNVKVKDISDQYGLYHRELFEGNAPVSDEELAKIRNVWLEVSYDSDAVVRELAAADASTGIWVYAQIDWSLDKPDDWKYHEGWDTGIAKNELFGTAYEYLDGSVNAAEPTSYEQILDVFPTKNVWTARGGFDDVISDSVYDLETQHGYVTRCNIDWSKHTLYVRVRYMARYTPQNGETVYLLSPWSETTAFGANGVEQPTDKPTIAPGTPMGDVLYTDIVAYIDDKPIHSYNIAGNTYIVVEDLAEYGFDVQWIAEGSGKLVVGTTRTAAPDGYTTTYVPEKNTHPAGSVAMQYLYTNITAWLGDAQVTGYNIGGYTCIGMDDLANTFATNYVWDGVEGALRLYTQP